MQSLQGTHPNGLAIYKLRGGLDCPPKPSSRAGRKNDDAPRLADD